MKTKLTYLLLIALVAGGCSRRTLKIEGRTVSPPSDPFVLDQKPTPRPTLTPLPTLASTPISTATPPPLPTSGPVIIVVPAPPPPPPPPVFVPRPSCRLSASPGSVILGKKVTLTLEPNGAVQQALLNGNFYVGPVSVTPTVGKESRAIFTASAKVIGPGGEGTCTVDYSVTASAYLPAIPLSTLEAVSKVHCSGAVWTVMHSLTCNAAASRFCQAQGFNGGILQHYDGAHANVLCLAGEYSEVTLGALNAAAGSPLCTTGWSNANFRACNRRASDLCRQRHFSGGAIQGFNSAESEANILCTGGELFPVTLSTLDSGGALCSGNWEETTPRPLYCNGGAGDFCRQREFNGGALINENSVTGTVLCR